MTVSSANAKKEFSTGEEARGWYDWRNAVQVLVDLQGPQGRALVNSWLGEVAALIDGIGGFEDRGGGRSVREATNVYLRIFNSTKMPTMFEGYKTTSKMVSWETVRNFVQHKINYSVKIMQGCSYRCKILKN